MKVSAAVANMSQLEDMHSTAIQLAETNSGLLSPPQQNEKTQHKTDAAALARYGYRVLHASHAFFVPVRGKLDSLLLCSAAEGCS